MERGWGVWRFKDFHLENNVIIVLVIVKTAAIEDLKSLALNKSSRCQCPPVQIASYFLLFFLNGIWLHNVIHYLPLNCLQLPFY